MQALQMVTQKGENTSVVAIHGNFDHAQSGVKALFEDQTLAKELDAAGYQFSSANSINIGRLVPQVVYYVYAYAKLLQNGRDPEWRENPCDSADRQLWKYFGGILCKADGSADRQVDLCVQ